MLLWSQLLLSFLICCSLLCMIMMFCQLINLLKSYFASCLQSSLQVTLIGWYFNCEQMSQRLSLTECKGLLGNVMQIRWGLLCSTQGPGQYAVRRKTGRSKDLRLKGLQKILNSNNINKNKLLGQGLTAAVSFNELSRNVKTAK